MAAYPELFTIGHQAYSSTGNDGYGNPVESWAASVSRAIYGVAPGVPGEDYEPGAIASEIPLFAYGSAAELGTVKARDRMVWLSETYNVDGNPENFNYGPFGFAPGVRVRLILREGG